MDGRLYLRLEKSSFALLALRNVTASIHQRRRERRDIYNRQSRAEQAALDRSIIVEAIDSMPAEFIGRWLSLAAHDDTDLFQMIYEDKTRNR